MHNSHLHWYQSWIISLCAPKHLAWVSLSAIYRDKRL
jgi:hypothetical protein